MDIATFARSSITAQELSAQVYSPTGRVAVDRKRKLDEGASGVICLVSLIPRAHQSPTVTAAHLHLLV